LIMSSDSSSFTMRSTKVFICPWSIGFSESICQSLLSGLRAERRMGTGSSAQCSVVEVDASRDRFSAHQTRKYRQAGSQGRSGLHSENGKPACYNYPRTPLDFCQEGEDNARRLPQYPLVNTGFPLVPLSPVFWGAASASCRHFTI
jgi:hypothetical protein